MDIHLVSGNKDKIREAELILGRSITSVAIDIDEIQEVDIQKIVEHKIMQAWDVIQKPVFVWDMGMYIHALHGFPGPLVKWFWKQIGSEDICKMLDTFNDRRCYAYCILAYHDGTDIHYFDGRIDGTIPPRPRGDNGWGWDPIFIPNGYDKTYAEMDEEQAVALRSHGPALQKFKEYIS